MIMKDEVEAPLKSMKKGKAVGSDNIIIETLQEGKEVILQRLAKLFNKCLQQREIPSSWKNANMVLLFKKENRKELKNYRPICLLSNIYELFTKMKSNRIQKT